MDRAGVSLVIPTYNRREALETTLPAFLAIDGVDEVILVVDGSTDGTAEFLATQQDPRLKVIEQANAGAPAARNAGVAAAGGAWLLLADDDCLFPPDYVEVMLRVAAATGADLLGAPWVLETDPDEAAAAVASAQRVDRISFDAEPWLFPKTTVETPFLVGSGGLFMRREVLDRVSYDDEYTVNAWREETDFAIRAAQAGFRSILTPETHTRRAGMFSGGQHGPAWAYERAVVVNNWRFLQRHGDWLREGGHIGAPWLEHTRLVGTRMLALAGRSVIAGLQRIGPLRSAVRALRARRAGAGSDRGQG